MKHFKLLFIFSVFLIYSCSDTVDYSLPSPEIEIEKRQYIIEGFQTITPCEAGNLTYFFEDCFEETGYEDAIPEAIELYNEIEGSSLNFTQVDNEEDADMVFNCVDTPFANCGEAVASPPTLEFPFPVDPNTQTQFPSGGTIGRDINLEINWDLCPCDDEDLDLCFFVHTVAHEIAHALGLYHNDIESLGIDELDPIHVAGTTTDPYDPNSIINSGGDEFNNGNWCTPVCEFNENDIIAFQTLYPEPEILGPVSICSRTSYYYCLPGEMVGSWSWGKKQKGGPNNPPTSQAPANCSTYSWANPGTYTISVNVCGVIYSQTITVLDCW